MKQRLVPIDALAVLGVAAAPARSGDPAPRARFERSANLTPHFERVGERSVFYVEGWPHTVLTVEKSKR